MDTPHCQEHPLCYDPNPVWIQENCSSYKRTVVFFTLQGVNAREQEYNFSIAAPCVRLELARPAVTDPYTLSRPSCWALMETKVAGHSVSTLSSRCPPHCPCIVPRSGCEKEQCIHYPRQPIIPGQPTQTKKLARFFSPSAFLLLWHVVIKKKKKKVLYFMQHCLLCVYRKRLVCLCVCLCVCVILCCTVIQNDTALVEDAWR